MQVKPLTHYSPALGKDMHVMIYGNGGIPFLAFPTQDGMCHQLEEFGFIDQIKDYIENRRIQVFVVDTVDLESWSARDMSKEKRAERQEQYYRYIVEQVIPLMRELNDALPFVIGMSMGADHAAITFLRRPDLFRGVLAMSGVYDADYFFDGFMNSTLYDNSPERFLPNMPADHPYIALYNEKKIIFCVGQGAWEEDGVRTLRHLQRVFENKGIHAWCDFWGYDVNHDWPWWFRQIRYFMPFLLDT
jgi:esterase/lipase superfamily enzyme